MTTEEEFRKVLASCRDLFVKKMHDYGVAWRILRPESLTDQIFIKANRIRVLEIKGTSLVDEGIIPDFVGIVNYSAMGLIQLEKGPVLQEDISKEEALRLYDEMTNSAFDLMLKKNHDYDEVWRAMRVSSYTDLILMKIFRTKQIEDLQGETLVSEGIAANYRDIMNYAVFALIKLTLE